MLVTSEWNPVRNERENGHLRYDRPANVTDSELNCITVSEAGLHVFERLLLVYGHDFSTAYLLRLNLMSLTHSPRNEIISEASTGTTTAPPPRLVPPSSTVVNVRGLDAVRSWVTKDERHDWRTAAIYLSPSSCLTTVTRWLTWLSGMADARIQEESEHRRRCWWKGVPMRI
ncbi:hypothetical protein Hypma_007020 [Hypsizygus marmoreus]|uniref:Uncharacterized protein n=1 Tax=Hypsizygus marmoreus TaxID=39966 RepID=A0A369KAS9_HYPMA|nr:hypothetical protein Hypma_007020 [Hypsizygus marmoreus]